MTDLSRHIQHLPLVDTHEHLRREAVYLENGPDILGDLFDNYVKADLVVAGATEKDIARMMDAKDPDVASRFKTVQKAWEFSKHTGYGEATRLIAKLAYGMDEITPEALEKAQGRNKSHRQPGERLRILKETANLHHVQIDDFRWQCEPDASGPDFFLYDLSWAGFCNGRVEPEAIEKEVGVVVKDLKSLRSAMEAIFAKHAPCAIAVKAQHAYNRTLLWRERDPADVEKVLQKKLKGAELDLEETLCLGDWGWAQGAELSIEHNLPFKIHTGYYAGHSRMPVERIAAGQMCAFFAKYLGARFVLMHIAYPYSDELAALAKHYPNLYVDLCWAWSIDPHSSADFVRKMIHTTPINKLFAFGGDTLWANGSLGYSIQARRRLTAALQAEVTEGWMTEREAIAVATRLMQTNQFDCFDIEGTRGAIRKAIGEETTDKMAAAGV